MTERHSNAALSMPDLSRNTPVMALGDAPVLFLRTPSENSTDLPGLTEFGDQIVTCSFVYCTLACSQRRSHTSSEPEA